MDRCSGPFIGQSLFGQNSRGRVSKGARRVCEAKGVSGVKGVCGGVCGGKGVCEGVRGGEGCYSPDGPGLPYKEENVGSAVIGVQGLRVGS